MNKNLIEYYQVDLIQQLKIKWILLILCLIKLRIQIELMKNHILIIIIKLKK